MKDIIEKFDIYLIEQDYACPECGHKFHSEWKNKECKCKKCGAGMSMAEAAMGKVFMGSPTFGKEKSKAWFKYRGLIQGVKSQKEMTALLNKMTKETKGAELQDLTNQALAKMTKLK